MFWSTYEHMDRGKFKSFHFKNGKMDFLDLPKDGMNDFFNPLICLSTRNIDRIDEKIIVNVKGKKIPISFKETSDHYYLKGKLAPMEESSIRRHEESLLVNSKATSNSTPRKKNPRKRNKSKSEGRTTLERDVLSGKDDQTNSKGINQEEYNIVVEKSSKEMCKGNNVEENSFDPLVSKSASSKEDAESSHIIASMDARLASSAKFSLHNQTSSETTVSETMESNSVEHSDFNESNADGSSHLSLCHNLDNLQMGKKAGRPRKKLRRRKNPFELGLKVKKQSRQCNKLNGHKKKKMMPSNSLVIYQENNGFNHQPEAGEIVQCALQLGLELARNKEGVCKEIENQLLEGNI